jgi:hypothetical protein
MIHRYNPVPCNWEYLTFWVIGLAGEHVRFNATLGEQLKDLVYAEGLWPEVLGNW